MAEQEFTAEELANEIWKPISQFPDYEVSTLGRVRSYRKSGGGHRDTPKILKQSAMRGYANITLINGDGRRQHFVHVLVLETFVGPRPHSLDNCFDACHNNHNRGDARLTNLRWDTHSANIAESVPHRKPSHCHKLYSEDVTAIRTRFKPRVYTQMQLAKDFKVSKSAILKVIHPDRQRKDSARRRAKQGRYSR